MGGRITLRYVFTWGSTTKVAILPHGASEREKTITSKLEWHGIHDRPTAHIQARLMRRHHGSKYTNLHPGKWYG